MARKNDSLTEPDMKTVDQADETAGDDDPMVSAMAREALDQTLFDDEDDDLTVPVSALEQTDEDVFGSYELLLRLSRGGATELHLAHDGAGHAVVLKRPSEAAERDAEIRALIDTEAQLGRDLVHPNVVQQLDSGRIADASFITFELVEGLNAEQAVILGGRLDVADAVEIGLGVARGLSHLSGLVNDDGKPLRFVHRDVSLRNILLGHDGAVKLAGLGVSMFEGRNTGPNRGLPPGQLAYMAPEQLRLAPVDPRADLYALGAVMFEMLSGSPLHPDGALLMADAPAQVRARLDSVPLPAALVEIVAAMVHPSTAKRPASARRVVEAFMTIRGAIGVSRARAPRGDALRSANQTPPAGAPDTPPSTATKAEVIRNVTVKHPVESEPALVIPRSDAGITAANASIEPSSPNAPIEAIEPDEAIALPGPEAPPTPRLTRRAREQLITFLVGMLILSWAAIAALAVMLIRGD